MSAYPAYNFGSAAREQQQYDRYGFEVVQGGVSPRSQEDASMLAAIVSAVARVLAVFVAVFVAVGLARVTLSSATISASLQAGEITSAIEEARTQGNALELEHSMLSNPAHIKDEAADLGMVVPDQTSYIILPQDIVVKDDEGNLSLSGSVAAAVGTEG